MKKLILILGFFTIISCCNSQSIHVIDFDSSHVSGNTDTTINVVIGDSVVVIHHQDDDDFEDFDLGDHFVKNTSTQQSKEVNVW